MNKSTDLDQSYQINRSAIARIIAAQVANGISEALYELGVQHSKAGYGGALITAAKCSLVYSKRGYSIDFINGRSINVTDWTIELIVKFIARNAH